MPKEADYPFYLMQLPFTKTESASLWVLKALFKQATLKEFYQELDSERDYRYDKTILKRLVKQRLFKE